MKINVLYRKKLNGLIFVWIWTHVADYISWSTVLFDYFHLVTSPNTQLIHTDVIKDEAATRRSFTH